MTRAIVWDTSRPRPGRRFEAKAELPLQEAATELASDLPGAHAGLLVMRELTGPFGIPDVVALVGGPQRLEARLALDVPPLLNQVDAGVVAVAHADAPRTVNSLAASLRWPT